MNGGGERGALKDALHFSNFRAACSLSRAHTSCLHAISTSRPHPDGLKGLFSRVFLFTHTHTHTPYPPVCPFPFFSPQSNYLASEGGNLLSLVAAQVPIRGNALHPSNELITLNELKTLPGSRSRAWKKKAGRQVGRTKGIWGTKRNKKRGECGRGAA